MPSSHSSPLHVLVIGDDAKSRETLSAMVRSLGHHTIAAVPGTEAARVLASHHADVALAESPGPGWQRGDSDQHLPGLPPSHGMRVLDNILDPVITLDRDERIVDANDAACRTFAPGGTLAGHTIEAVTGQALSALVAPGLVELRQHDGTHYPAEVSASEWREGTAVRTTLVLRNFRERLRIEQMRDEFLAMVGHELRTPLTSVLGAVGLLASGAMGALSPSATTLIGVAQRNGERLSKLIDDILDLTKLEGERMVMHLRAQNVVPLVSEAIVANQSYADRSGVTLRGDFPPQTAAAAPQVRLDADRFLQVMANLLSNAIKHSPSSGDVVVTVRSDGVGYAIRVTDSGPGIAPEFRAQLFEKFSQADMSDRRTIGGTGLGLHISRLMVERMGGRIAALPGQGDARGATFELWFPFSSGGTRPAPHPRPLRAEGDL